MTLQVIGAGFGRTGTNSLKIALEMIGFGPCYHMLELQQRPQDLPYWWRAVRSEPVEWKRLFADYRSAVDWPVCSFWEPLSHVYPDAKIILTERDPEQWYESAANTIFDAMDRANRAAMSAETRERLDMARALVIDQVFGGRHRDREHAIKIYAAHNERVRRTVPAARLLVLDPTDGWPPLCGFLGVDPPDEPYPFVNTREQYKQRFARPGDTGPGS